MSALHPYIRFLGTLPQFEVDHHRGTAVELRSGVVVAKYEGEKPHHAHCLGLVWPGQPTDQPVLVSATKYVPLQVAEAIKLGAPRAELLEASRHIFVEAGERH
ncbi:MAG: hypothetical protein QHC78_18900 [Pigmentiphaga sp.]|uniref:hypothetical protein n=1 Tax=Pigmentiphaga sp. TaxID=1977564 RepID=UPI0029A3AEBB|nr:hypothetical protein [Pigmentiphaga sp.]MDX3907761.1 hypothetical protein [Pigmentiphaga sp.]